MPRFNPAAPAPTGPIIRLSVQQTLQTQLYECILDYMATAPLPVSLATLGGFLAAWRVANESQWRAVLSNQANLGSYIAGEVAIGTTPSFVLTGLLGAGTVMAPPLPGTVAVVVTKTSSLKGQHGRGRFFGPAVPNSFVTPATDPNTLNAAGAAAYLALLNGLLIPVIGGGGTWNLTISTRPIAPVTVVTNAIPVLALTAQTILGNVRRRREGRGI